MVFSSVVFLFVFLPVVLAGYYLLDRRFRNIFLLLVSLMFYAWGEPRFVFVMIGSILMNYVFALLTNRFRNSKRIIAKIIIAVTILANITLFWVFKYMAFTVDNVNRLLGSDIVVPKVALPIGISFFTFQAISYVIDVYRGKGEVQKNPLNVGLYIAFFPQLIAGPIVRYETVAKEIKSRKETLNDFCDGMYRFVWGLGKKIILSNSLAIVADYSFNNVSQDGISVVMAWVGAICYTLQIYFDFSGYSDMAIGLGRMFGFHFNENFDYPYIAKSVTDFWRRWHISLSSWFRDYVYIPLGGSRVGRIRNIFNLFVVWTLTGIWHGASWNFICWGWLYFAVLVFEKVTDITRKINNTAGKCVYRLFTLFVVIIAWVLFRAPGLKAALQYIKNMFGMCGNVFADRKTIFIIQDNLFIIVMAIILSTPLIKKIVERIDGEKGQAVVEIGRSIVLIGIYIISVCIAVSSSYNPFIYFNF